jgi:GntR family histidine utilization transcriptional repressor
MNAVTKPRYQQLKDLIISRISSGDLRPDDRVPSENELVESMRVSRMTANRALRELTDEGYVERIAGRGTFVADFRARSHVLEVQNIADEVSRRGHQHRCETIKKTQDNASTEVAAALQIQTGTEVFHLILVHYENDLPIQIEDRFIVAEFAPGCLQQDFATITPSAFLTAIAPLQEAEQVVRAAMPDAVVRDRLQMEAAEPTLLVTRRTWAHGHPVTFAKLHHPGSRFELTGHYTPPGTQRSMLANGVSLEDLQT